MDQERMVYQRYKKASREKESALCCPTSYSSQYLKIIPEEIIEKDYGCGDPSRYVLEGEVVLDLGSGGGKLVYILAQLVGKMGRVIGVDMNKDMINLAKKYESTIAESLGYKNFEFKRARIQNLKLDLDKLDKILQENPVKNIEDYLELEFKIKELEKEECLIADECIDVVVSNCVLNLVRDEDKKNLFTEIFRVLKKDGRAVISDIVSDKDVPEYMKKDPDLWSGCISGAMREDHFISAFKYAGFKYVDIIKKDDIPWKTVDGINFYSISVCAYKGDKKIKYKSCCGKEVIDINFQDRLKLLKKSLCKEKIDVIQINVGGLCNQSCSHCHLSAGPDDKRVMKKDIMNKIIDLIKRSDIEAIDITGGAPELNPDINYLLSSLKALGKKIIFRTNLTVLSEKEELLFLLCDKNITIYASLPSVVSEETDNQRGKNVFEKSVRMLKRLNDLGFGEKYQLNIVYNPIGFELPENNITETYKDVLSRSFAIKFNDLITITNSPIGNYKVLLEEKNKYDEYIQKLMMNFNKETIDGLMCKRLINIGYDGSIYDCDFNNALDLKIKNINEIENLSEFVGLHIKVGNHCYSCTAKKGSSCFGSLCS